MDYYTYHNKLLGKYHYYKKLDPTYQNIVFTFHKL